MTSRHMTEFHGLDVEMAINEHYHEMLDVFSDLFFFIFDGLNRDCKPELEIVRQFSPFKDLVYRRPGAEERALVLTFAQAIDMLAKDAGEGRVTPEDLDKLRSLGPDSDPSTPVEKRLGLLVKEQFGVDFYMLDKYPAAVRPFYTMPDALDPRLSNSYDFFIRGQEILSGAQRVHDAHMLERAVEARGIPKQSLHFYIDAFRDGALPHAGGGIGLERVVMLFLGLPNIRWAALFSRDPKRLSP
jgi:aspartyl/asparaginyl-tRNA synthetase